MSQRPTLDPSSFGKLMEAAFVLQQYLEREARSNRLRGLGTSAPPPAETRSKSDVVSKREIRIPWVKQSSQLPQETRARENAALDPLSFLDGGHLASVARTASRRYRLSLAQLTTAARYFESSLKSVIRFGTRSWVMLLVTTGALMFFDLHYGHPHIFAATTRMADQPAVPTAEPPKPASHRRVTDPHISSVVDALSPYEIRGLQRQAEYGDDEAALTIGMAYETGRSVAQNCKQAAEWVARAAHDGNAAAQYNLSLRYRTGDGVPVNALEADKWLRKAAGHKYAEAVPDQYGDGGNNR